MAQQTENQSTRDSFNRRTFLRGAAASSAVLFFAGCGVATPSTPQPELAPFPAWHPLLPSPQARGTAEPAATPGPERLSLDGFLALSSLLTGIDDLDTQVGQVYLDSLAVSDQFDLSLAELYQQAGFTEAMAPVTIEELEQRGIFDQEATRSLADKIIEYWYSGVYDTPEGEPAVATFADALVWHAVRYTKPLTICAAPGFWAVAPHF
jgi:hypothetical protein